MIIHIVAEEARSLRRVIEASKYLTFHGGGLKNSRGSLDGRDHQPPRPNPILCGILEEACELLAEVGLSSTGFLSRTDAFSIPSPEKFFYELMDLISYYPMVLYSPDRAVNPLGAISRWGRANWLKEKLARHQLGYLAPQLACFGLETLIAANRLARHHEDSEALRQMRLEWALLLDTLSLDLADIGLARAGHANISPL